jgi:segregation and condensation protein B
MTKPLKFIIESLLFVSEDPLSVQQLKNILETEETDTIRAALEALTDEYDGRGGGFELRQVAGGFQFRTRSEYSDWVKKLLKPSPAKLSRAALETLAIIAYKQPIIRGDVEHLRGVDCGGVLRMLLEKKLIRVLGRKDIPGRPMIYGTTREFLEVFNLKDLRDLPSPKEIESLGTETEEISPLSEEDAVTQLTSDSTLSTSIVRNGNRDSNLQDAGHSVIVQENREAPSQKATPAQLDGHDGSPSLINSTTSPSDTPMEHATLTNDHALDSDSQHNDTESTPEPPIAKNVSQENHDDGKKS